MTMTTTEIDEDQHPGIAKVSVPSLEGLDADSCRAAILYEIKVSEIGHHLRSLLKAVDEANEQGRVLGLTPVERSLLKPLSYPVSGASRSGEDRISRSDRLPETCDLSHVESRACEHGSPDAVVVEPPATVRDWLSGYADFLFDLRTPHPTIQSS